MGHLDILLQVNIQRFSKIITSNESKDVQHIKQIARLDRADIEDRLNTTHTYTHIYAESTFLFQVHAVTGFWFNLGISWSRRYLVFLPLLHDHRSLYAGSQCIPI